MKVTIYDVAKRAGVSISTASKALNDRKDVGDGTKLKIREIAKELNYEPSHFARALAMRKTENIGVLTVRYYGTPMLTNPFYSKIIEGIEEQLISSNLNLLTNIMSREQIDTFEIPKMVKEKNVDGLILLGYIPEDFVDMVAGRGLPVVAVDNHVKNPAVGSIVMDDVAGAHAAVSYLIKTGHRRIGYISGPSSRHSFKRREEGYKKALSEAGLKVDERFVIFNEPEAQGYDWMKKILSYPEKPDAIFFCNDVNTILAINMLKEEGLKVPDDISVIGFDNIEMGQHFIPSISTVDIDKEKMGMKAVEMLLDRISKKSTEPERLVFPVNLIIRDSVKTRG
jgi:DNA-binding LacI/PurR family transcriptional regulator